MAVTKYRGKEAEDEHKILFEAALKRDTKLATNTLKTHIIKGLEHTLSIFK